MKHLVYLKDGILYWRERTPDTPIPDRYKTTANLFNSQYADTPITTATFKCSGKTHAVSSCYSGQSNTSKGCDAEVE